MTSVSRRRSRIERESCHPSRDSLAGPPRSPGPGYLLRGWHDVQRHCFSTSILGAVRHTASRSQRGVRSSSSLERYVRLAVRCGRRADPLEVHSVARSTSTRSARRRRAEATPPAAIYAGLTDGSSVFAIAPQRPQVHATWSGSSFMIFGQPQACGGHPCNPSATHQIVSRIERTGLGL